MDIVQVVPQDIKAAAGAPDQCGLQQKLQSLLHSLGWTYAAVWTFSPQTRCRNKTNKSSVSLSCTSQLIINKMDNCDSSQLVLN